MAGALNFDHWPVGADFFQRSNVQPSYRIAIADDYLDRHLDRLDLFFGERKLAHTSLTGSAYMGPEFLKRGALTKISHTAECAGQGAIGMLGDKFQRDQTAHRVADDVRLSNFQMIEQEHHVVDPLIAVRGRIGRLVGFAIAGQIERDDLMIFCERIDCSGHLPIDPRA